MLTVSQSANQIGYIIGCKLLKCKYLKYWSEVEPNWIGMFRQMKRFFYFFFEIQEKYFCCSIFIRNNSNRLLGLMHRHSRTYAKRGNEYRIQRKSTKIKMNFRICQKSLNTLNTITYHASSISWMAYAIEILHALIFICCSTVAECTCRNCLISIICNQ